MATKNRGRRRPNGKKTGRPIPGKTRSRQLTDTWRPVPQSTKEDGHSYVTIIDDRGREVDLMMAEAVLESFGFPRPSPGHRVYHRNGEKRDNRLINLEWRLLTIFPERSNN